MNSTQDKKRKSPAKYSEEFKTRAVKLFYKSGMTQKRFAKRIKVPEFTFGTWATNHYDKIRMSFGK